MPYVQIPVSDLFQILTRVDKLTLMVKNSAHLTNDADFAS